MDQIIFILISAVLIFSIIEITIFFIVRYVNKKFPWLIIKKDEKPKLSIAGLQKFIPHGYDSELGWVRKPNTNNKEEGKNGTVTWSINSIGARTNPNFDEKNSEISCYGDSFTFSRQVNDNETWSHYLSQIRHTNVLNFGVGNYGIDQAFLRLKREFPTHRTKIVILGVVPDTISRIVSVWKHYYEYGNTFGFKPRFIIKNNQLSLIKNPIDNDTKFVSYQEELDTIKQNDFFYKNKFKKELLHFPYCITILKNFKRNTGIIYWVLKIHVMKKFGYDISDIEWNPMQKIMNINLKWRIQLFKDSHITDLLTKIIEEFIQYSKKEKFTPVFVFLPQKDDLLFIQQNYNFYNDFLSKLKEISSLQVLDITNDLLKETEIAKLYSDQNTYGGHYSKEGNQKIASLIDSYMK